MAANRCGGWSCASCGFELSRTVDTRVCLARGLGTERVTREAAVSGESDG